MKHEKFFGIEEMLGNIILNEIHAYIHIYYIYTHIHVHIHISNWVSNNHIIYIYIYYPRDKNFRYI